MGHRWLELGHNEAVLWLLQSQRRAAEKKMAQFGDPLVGRLMMSQDSLQAVYSFIGFFLRLD
jgi:hypothetical protein